MFILLLVLFFQNSAFAETPPSVYAKCSNQISGLLKSKGIDPQKPTKQISEDAVKVLSSFGDSWLNLIALYPEFYSTRSKFRINADGSVSPRDEDPNAPKPEDVSFTSIFFGKKGSVSYSKDRTGISLGQDEFLSLDPESCKVNKASRPYASVSTRFCSKFESEFVPLAEKAMRESRPDTPQKQCEFQGGTWRDETCRCQRSTWAPALRIQDLSSETCFSIRVKTYMELAHEKSYELGGTVDPTAKAIKDARELCRLYFAQSVAPAKDAGSARGAK